MSSHMAPNRLEPSRGDQRHRPGGSRKHREQRPRDQVTPYEVSSYPQHDYPRQLDQPDPPTHYMGETSYSSHTDYDPDYPDDRPPRVRIDLYGRSTVEAVPSYNEGPSSNVFTPTHQPDWVRSREADRNVPQEPSAGWVDQRRHRGQHDGYEPRGPEYDHATNHPPADTGPVNTVQDTPPAQPVVPAPASQPAPQPVAAIAPPQPAQPDYREIRDLLMRTIQLYSDDWKLGGIRTNKNRQVAYLTPRGKTVDLKTAIHRQEALIIQVDNHGNTDVKEPKKPGLLRRFFDWLMGA